LDPPRDSPRRNIGPARQCVFPPRPPGASSTGRRSACSHAFATASTDTSVRRTVTPPSKSAFCPTVNLDDPTSLTFRGSRPLLPVYSSKQRPAHGSVSPGRKHPRCEPGERIPTGRAGPAGPRPESAGVRRRRTQRGRAQTQSMPSHVRNFSCARILPRYTQNFHRFTQNLW
jgi:hypothetical protein